VDACSNYCRLQFYSDQYRRTGGFPIARPSVRQILVHGNFATAKVLREFSTQIELGANLTGGEF